MDWDVWGIEDDEYDVVDPIFIRLIANRPISAMDWSSKETKIIEERTTDVLERTQERVTKKKKEKSCPQTRL